MLNTNFITTLVAIIVSLMLLFQGEIKEKYTKHTPDVWNHYPKNGLVSRPYFGPWGGNGVQLTEVEVAPDVDPKGNPIAPINRNPGGGFDTSFMYKTPSTINASNIVPPTPTPTPTTKEGFSLNNGVQIEAARNLQPMTGGSPRFIVTGPKLNLYSPIDMPKYAVDQDHPIVNYGCDDVYSEAGQPIKVDLPVRENYDDAQPRLPLTMNGSGQAPNGMMSLNGQPAQPIIHDRKMYSNLKSRLSGQGDPIRGDLKIVPNLYMSDGGSPSFKEKEFSKHFQVSVKPSRDLRSGYIDYHNDKGNEFNLNAYANGIVPNMYDTKNDNVEVSLAASKYKKADEKQRPSMIPSFGGKDSSIEKFTLPRYMQGRSNDVVIEHGGETVNIGNYGL